MEEKNNNQYRFNILRGYYQDGKFHSQGGQGVSLENLLGKLGFNELDDFLLWYESLTAEEIKNGKKDWCSGNCCQSILLRLLKLKAQKETLAQLLARKENLHRMKGKLVTRVLKDLFAALVLDDKERKYYLYLVNQSNNTFSNITALTGAYQGSTDDFVKTNEIEKGYGILNPKSFLLLEEDYQNMLDFTVWYNLNIYLSEKNIIKCSFHFRYSGDSKMEMLPIINKVGLKIELKQE